MIWIMLFLGLSLTSARIVLISADSDPALHRRLGDWMIQNHAIVRKDNLLHTYHGPIVSNEWLSEVIFAGATRALGWNGSVFLAAVLIATCFWLLHRLLLAEGSDPVLATGLVFVATSACSMHWLARPLLFTHLLSLVFAWQLRWFQNNRVTTRRMFLLLPVLMVLWVNLHGAFITGLVLIAMYALGSAISAWRQSTSLHKSKTFAALLLVCGAVTFVNPNGWELHRHILSFLRSRELSTVTTEFASPNFHTVGMRGFLLLLLVVVTTLLIARPQPDATDILLVGGWGYLALLSARNVPIFALVTTPLLAQWIMEFAQTHPHAFGVRLCRRWTMRITTLGRRASDVPIVITAVCVLLVMAKPRVVGGTSLLPTDFPSSRYPTSAVNYLRAHPGAVRGEMFNYFLWGGYLEFAFPERKPFIDSRNVMYGLDLTHDFQTVNEPKPGWKDVFVRYNVGWTILPVQHPLNRILGLSPQWTPVFSNELTLVFSRTP
jgi:hypothetical protein